MVTQLFRAVCAGKIEDAVKKIDGVVFKESGVETIYYEGTAEEWKTLEKSEIWNKDMKECEVICADGTVIREVYVKPEES